MKRFVENKTLQCIKTLQAVDHLPIIIPIGCHVEDGQGYAQQQ